MSLLDPLRNYCERSGPNLWDEPLNAISNAAFFIAAWLLYTAYRKKNIRDPQIATLIFLLALIGCGSTLFHTFANGLTMIGDVVPIALFTFTYLWLALRRLVGLQRLSSTLALLAFAMVGALTSHLPPGLRFNGSADYFPCLAALFIIGTIIHKREQASAITILKAAFCFTISIIFRSLDMQLCPTIPIGTHFIWHILNALVLYLLVSTLLKRTEKNHP